MKKYEIVIIGSGVVGLSSAMYAKRLGLKTLVLGNLIGGTIASTGIIENYPGFKFISGLELSKRILDHAKEYDPEIKNERVENIEKTRIQNKNCFKIITQENNFFTKTILFATGTKIKKLGVSGEKEFSHKGVSYCALCDGPLFKNKEVGVIGGGDSAVKESILLSQYAKKVYLIYRGREIKCEPINLKRLNEKIKERKVEVILQTNVLKIKGKEFLEGVTLDKTYKKNKELKLQGLFIYVGHEPLSKLAKQIGVKLNKKKEIIINRNSETNIKGIYAAGDVCDTRFKQAITGIGEGVTAAYNAYEFVKQKKFEILK